jgi:hypothetical protein
VFSGAAAFLLAHLLERYLWASWFADRSMVAWFTNSGRAVLVTVLFVFAAAAISGTPERDRREVVRGAASVAAGAIVTMMIALMIVGPGTIAPIVIVADSLLIIAAAFAGALMVMLLSRGAR